MPSRANKILTFNKSAWVAAAPCRKALLYFSSWAGSLPPRGIDGIHQRGRLLHGQCAPLVGGMQCLPSAKRHSAQCQAKKTPSRVRRFAIVMLLSLIASERSTMTLRCDTF
jgi:hypothetical protein